MKNVENQQADDADALSLEIAKRWCLAQGSGWAVIDQAGRGGTAPVYSVSSPQGLRALKIYDAKFSSGAEGEIQFERVRKQVSLGDHECPNLVKVYAGGKFEDRLFVVMSRAPGKELEKMLSFVPREKIRAIVDQIARAALFLEQKGLCHRDIKSANIFVSDDFEQATLLDVSVLRDISCPVGTGTDHGNRLPMIATARYSPPEYLFRLLEPSKESWHALNVYQLGALLYDLISREMIFEAEERICGDNRYRFAWIVATVNPEASADDVDRDLLDLTRRALDKDWERRSTISLSDFFDDMPARRDNALRLLGISNLPVATHSVAKLPMSQIISIAQLAEDAFAGELLRQNVRCIHKTKRAGPNVQLTFSWEKIVDSTEPSEEITYYLDLTGIQTGGGAQIAIGAKLESKRVEESASAAASRPPILITDRCEVHVVEVAREMLAQLAVELAKVHPLTADPLGGE